MSTALRLPHLRPDLPAAVVASWRAMGDTGKIRRHKRSGRLYLDFRGHRRLWTQRVGGASIPFETESDAARVLEAVRWHLAQEKGLDEVLALFRGDRSPENQIGPKLAKWIEQKRREARAGDRSPTYVRELERYAEPTGHFSWWAGYGIHDIAYGRLEDWSAWLADERKLAPKTRWNVMAAFHAFAVWLYKREDLTALPREFPWPKVPEHAPAVLSLQAQAQVLAAVPEPERGIFLALGLMGLRPGEAVALSAGDARDGWLTVARARKGKRLSDPIRGTKSGTAKRLPMPAELVEWIDAQPPRAPGSPLFPNPRTGGRWTPTSLRRAWTAACTAVGVSISLYEGTKHTFATDAALRGVSERALQAYLGHRDPRSTRKYARLSDGALLDVIGRTAGGRADSEKSLLGNLCTSYRK